MGCGASRGSSVTSTSERELSPISNTTKNDETQVVHKQSPADPCKGSSYAETGPCAVDEEHENTTIDKMCINEIKKKFPDVAQAISSFQEVQGNVTASPQYWKSLQQMNNVAPTNRSIEDKNDISEYCVSQGLHEMIVEDFKKIQAMYSTNPDDILVTNWASCYYLFLTTLNYTDALRAYSKALVDKGIIQILIFFMKEIKDFQLENDQSYKRYIVKVSVEMMVNLSRGVPAQVLNDNGVVEVLIPFVHSKDKSIAVAALIALAAVVDEEQNDLLMANPEPIKLIIQLLETALCYKTHRLEEGTQWSAFELGDGLSQIAVNDKNKIEIVKQGGLQVLRKFLMKAKDSTEEASAARCFWMLAFNGDNVKKIKEFPDCIEKLRTLKESKESKVSSAASGALWEIEQKAKRGEDIKASHSNVKERAKADDGEMPHIMISYQWDVQKTLIKVKNSLQQSGYRVWMDVDQMQGSTLEAMAKAVENSAVVLMCISSKYKESPNCRSEAEYAFQLKKDIIPLMVEKNFKPDGWLGMIVGAKLWYNFYESVRVQETVDKLLKELNTRAPQAVVGAQVEVLGTQGPSSVQTSAAASGVSKWKEKDVMSWVNEIGLSQRVKIDAFGQFTGDLLIELWKLKHECPAVYYSSLEKDLGIVGLMDILRFNRALTSSMPNH